MNDTDSLEAFERQDTKHKLPLGWLLLFVGLILFGIYYSYAYLPATTGWTQVKEYEESLKAK